MELSTLEVYSFSNSDITLLWILQIGALPLFVICFAFWWSREEKPFQLGDAEPLDAELVD